MASSLRWVGSPVSGSSLGLLALLVILPAPTRAAVVVEAVQAPPGAVSPLQVGDELLRWRLVRGAPARGGELAHWGELDLLPLIESPRGPLEIELVRGGSPLRATLPPAAWTFKGMPAAASAELQKFVAALGEKDSRVTIDEVQRRLVGEPADAAGWVWARFGEASGKRSDWRSAQQAYAAAIPLSPPSVAADLERFHGDALRRLGQLDDAEASYRRALVVWNRIEPEGLGVSMAHGALGHLLASRHELAEAKRHYAEVTQIRRRLAPGSWLHANALNNLATLAGRRNDLAAAEAHLLEALEIAERGQGDAAPIHANLGVVARLRGDHDRSEMYTRRALDLFRAAGNSTEVAAKLVNLGNVLGDAGRFDEALAAFGEALASHEGQAPDRDALAKVRVNRAQLHLLRGDRAAAGVEIAAARSLLPFEVPRTDPELLLSALLAEQAQAQGDLAEAARWGVLTLEGRQRLHPDTALEALAASHLAKIRELQGRLPEAETLFRRSIEALERQQQRFGGGERGLVAFRSKYSAIYRDHQGFLLRRGRTGAAFELYERSRARALLALLQQRDLDFAESELPPGLARRRAQLALEIERGYAAFARLPESDTAAREQQRLSLEALHADRERLAREIHSASPRLAAIEAPPALALDEIRRALAPGTLLLAYSVGVTSSTLFALTPGGELTAHPIGAGEAELDADVARWVALTTATTLRRAELQALERRLSDLLLAPVAGRFASAARLLVVPDGALHRLPFAALPDPRAPARRVIESLAVSRQVSASVHASLGQRRPQAIERVAVFADPASAATAPARFRRELGRLPATRREATRVGAVFGDRARLFVDTEATARREIASASLTHFACHAVVDEALPLDSALLLSPSDGDEGFLQAWEIAEQVRLRSDLVALSGCETARGGERGGEGILGLVRALQVAGAKSVVASLWRVEDESAAELMARFYRGVAAGRPLDEALREAQLELLRGPVRTERDGSPVELRLDGPRHWAPFVLIGPGQ